MEVAASVGTELALSGLSRVISKLASNFGGDVTPDEMEHLNVFVGYKIEALIREAKSDDLVKSAPLLEKLQAAALELEDLLDLYEYNQLEKQLASLGNLQRCTYLLIRRCPMLKREEPSVVEGVVEGDIANRLPQVEHIETDEPLLVLELVQQQAFSSIKSLTVTDCAAALPNLENLSSLHSLHINRYPDIESLPNLPVSLQSIWIHECPKLKDKYEEGGPLRNTISHIPRIVFHNSNLDCM